MIIVRQEMGRGKRFIERWNTDYDFMTIITAIWSLFVSVIFALYNGFIGMYHASLWHGTISFYYFLLVIIRGIIIIAEKKVILSAGQEKAGDKVYLAASVLLLILNISLIVPITIMVKQQKPVHLTIIPAIAMAAYTTYNISMAFINLRRSRNSSDSLVRLLRMIGFIDALVSILSLQNTLIMVSAKEDSMKMMPLTAFTSAAILILIIILSVISLNQGITGISGKNN